MWLIKSIAAKPDFVTGGLTNFHQQHIKRCYNFDHLRPYRTRCLNIKLIVVGEYSLDD